MIVCHCTNITDHDIRAAIDWMRAADPQARVVDQSHIISLNLRFATLGFEPTQQRVMDHGRRVADTLENAADLRADDPFDREQGHLGVICDCAVQPHVSWQLRNAGRKTTANSG